MPARGTKIQAADLAALATLANTNLLPLVNAAVAAGTWPGHAYSKYDDPPTNAVLTNPQPAYAFTVDADDWRDQLNRIRADYWNLIFNSGLGADARYLNPDNLLSGPWIVGVIDSQTFPNGDTVSSQFTTPPLTGLLRGGADAGNRAMPLYSGVRFIFSDPPPDNLAGDCGAMLPESFLYGASSTGGFAWGFNYDCNEAGTWTCRVFFPFTGPGIAPPAATAFAIGVTPDFGWTWQTGGANGNYVLIGTLAGYALAASSGSIDFTASPPAGYAFTDSSPNAGDYYWIGWLFSDLVYESSSQLDLAEALHPETTGRQLTLPDIPAGATFTLQGDNATIAGVQPVVYCQYRWHLSDSTAGVWIAKTLPVPGINGFLDQDMPPYVGDARTIGAGQHVAVAPTLVYPSLPANINGEPVNFVDNPPTTQTISNETPRLTSSMRQQAYFRHGNRYVTVGGIPVDAGAAYNLIAQSCQPQPAQWLRLKDSDFVPWDYNFNTDDEQQVSRGITAPGDGSLWFSAVGVLGADVRGFKLRLVAPNTGVKGWKNGALQYGEPLGTNLTIYGCTVDKGVPGPTNYDLVTHNNAVTIDGTQLGDGGKDYLKRILETEMFTAFNFAVQNTSGADVPFDLIVEFMYAPQPRRRFLPNLDECFSYFIDGAPAAGDYLTLNTATKPVPQSGYCIYKVRATRLPVQNAKGISLTPESGDEITVLLGQNRLQPDGKLLFAPFASRIVPGAGDDASGAGDDATAGGSGQPFNLVIPADARDSGDVAVFIPVLAGNELVYRASADCIVEAWANWQPVFFSSQYGMDNGVPDATAFQYCLAFANWLDPLYLNYPFSGFHKPCQVQFPPAVDLYNDLENCLNLL